MSHDLRARLAAAEALLSTRNCPQQSKLQADAVKCLLVRECDQMAPDVKADVAVLLNRIPWHSGHLDMLLSVLATAKAPVAASSRRPQQDWMRIVDMYPKSSWDAFQSTGASLCDVLENIVDIAARLGLRLPSEDTFHVMNSMRIACVQASYSEDSKLALLEDCKRSFRKRVRFMHKPEPLIHELPLASEFKLRHADVYASIYSDADPPIPCPIVQRVIMIDNSYPRRVSRSQTSVQTLQSHRTPGSIAEQTMLTLSNLVLSNMMGGQFQGIPSFGLRRQQSNASLDGGVPLLRFPGQRRELPMGDQHRMALEGSEASSHSSLDRPPSVDLGTPGGALSLTGPITAASAQASSPPESPSTLVLSQTVPPQGSSTLAPRSCELYSMLQERDEEKKAAAALKRKSEKDAASRSARRAELASELAAEVLKLSAAPVKAKIGAKAVAKATAHTPVKKKTGATAVAKAKAYTPVKGKIGAKAVAKATAQSTQKVAADKPSFSHERSRQQFLFRTGVRGAGQSERFVYGDGGDSESVAFAKVKKRHAEALEQWQAGQSCRV